MIHRNEVFFGKLLKNERSFHLLFCEEKRSEYFSLYYNKVFADDPIFNHFIINDVLLQQSAPINSEQANLFIKQLRSTAEEQHLSTSIFIENFWPRASQIEEIAIDQGYRVTDKMEILTKRLDIASWKNEKTNFNVSTTEDVEVWTNVFMASYRIPQSWKEELLRREKEILPMENAKFVLAEDSEGYAGCLFTFNEPRDCLGIYCVGTVPEQRGRGIARAMLLFTEEIAKKRGLSLLTLQTLTSDQVAPMYKKLGYTTEFERDILWAPLMP